MQTLTQAYKTYLNKINANFDKTRFEYLQRSSKILDANLKVTVGERVETHTIRLTLGRADKSQINYLKESRAWRGYLQSLILHHVATEQDLVPLHRPHLKAAVSFDYIYQWSSKLIGTKRCAQMVIDAYSEYTPSCEFKDLEITWGDNKGKRISELSPLSLLYYLQRILHDEQMSRIEITPNAFYEKNKAAAMRRKFQDMFIIAAKRVGALDASMVSESVIRPPKDPNRFSVIISKENQVFARKFGTVQNCVDAMFDIAKAAVAGSLKTC